MKFITPTDITDSEFVSSDVLEDDYDEYENTTFIEEDSNARAHRGMCCAKDDDDDVYVCVFNGDIYKQSAATGSFSALSQTSRYWMGMAAAPNGNIYACVTGPSSDIYMQTAGAGNFSALSQTSRDYYGMCAAPNGNIYACVNGGDIYMQTNGAGNFNALSQTSRNWIDMAAAPNGDIYACVNTGDIYKQTAGSGDFVALGLTNRAWGCLAIDSAGNIYAGVVDGDVYFCKAGESTFTALGQTTRYWRGAAVTSSDDIYIACTALSGSGRIYKLGSGTVYNDGDNVIVADTGVHKIYESLVNNNNNNYPPDDDGTNWLEVSPTNRWKPFDDELGTQASQATSLTYVLAPGVIDSVALLALESTSVQIIEIDEDDDLVTNGQAWTDATGTTQPTGWDKVGTPTDFTIDSGALKITVDAASEGISQTITVSESTEYQLVGIYKNTDGDIAQYAVYDVSNSDDILATTDLASKTGFSTLSYVFTTPAGCTSVKISLMAKTAGDIVWFDSIVLAPTGYSETVTTGLSRTDIVKTDLPGYTNALLTVTITNTGGTAKIGELIVGTQTNIGITLPNPTFSIKDYSTKTQDVYGQYTIVERGFSKKASCDVYVADDDIDEVARLLAQCRATAKVWIIDPDYAALIVYGFYVNFTGSIPIKDGGAFLPMEIESLSSSTD